MFKRKNGSGALLWRAGVESYFDGIDGAMFRALINTVAPHTEAQEISGTHRSLIRQAAKALEFGQLVALNWRSKDGRYDHWVLAVGIEGIYCAGQFEAIALLCLDPSAPEPVLSAYNGHLQLREKRGGQHRGYLPYVTNQGLIFTVTVQEIVVIGSRVSEA
ncbi:hypothetical protein [Duganella radicis]|uniref:Uncharacterized protein n=1 Tax=Duganella radicis TaxID=551988 RepID=A0A6L6PGC5_9BURK|nr:hypothetical protein [Duganella radicis]MTV38042.1 hypothetical protein [Duganella radicis]